MTSPVTVTEQGSRKVEPSPTIRDVRLARGLSQEALARRADCSTIYVRLLESGYAPTHSDVLPRIMRVLNEKRPGGDQVALTTSPGGQAQHAHQQY